MILDFSKITGTEDEAQKGVKYRLENKDGETDKEKAVKLAMEQIVSDAEEQAPTLAIQYELEKKAFKSAADVCKKYQDNIKKSQLIRAELVKGYRAGEDMESLFLKACNVIMIMTGDRGFMAQIEHDYGGRKERKNESV